MSNTMKRREFLKLAGTAVLAVSAAGILDGCSSTEIPEFLDGNYTIFGTIIRSEDFKTDVKTSVYCEKGGRTIRVVSDHVITQNIDGKIYTSKVHDVNVYTLSNNIQKIVRKGMNLGDSVIFYVPEGTVVQMSWTDNEFSGSEFQWYKTNTLKTDEELTTLGDEGKISSGNCVTISKGGYYQFCWANEEDSYAVDGNIVFCVN